MLSYKQHYKQYLQAKEIANQQIRYREALTKYGIIPFLMTLQRFESQERYELCQLITDTIKRANMHPRVNAPVKLNQSLLKLLNKNLQTYNSMAYQCYNYLLNIEEKHPLLKEIQSYKFKFK